MRRLSNRNAPSRAANQLAVIRHSQPIAVIHLVESPLLVKGGAATAAGKLEAKKPGPKICCANLGIHVRST
jgi:hypothetical protein